MNKESRDLLDMDNFIRFLAGYALYMMCVFAFAVLTYKWWFE